MELVLKRKWFTPLSTISELYINGNYQCLILEDTDRGLQQIMTLEQVKALKVDTKTCVPYGRYEIVITFSNRFQKDLPLLLNVPGFSGIRIHPGNVAADTDGCLLPGVNRIEDKVINSKVAFAPLVEKITETLNNQEHIFITIIKEPEKQKVIV